jgi:LIM domain
MVMADDDWKRWMVMIFQKMVAETKDARTTLQAVGWFFVETLVVDRQQPSSNVHQSLLKVVYTRIKASYYDYYWRTRDRNWPTNPNGRDRPAPPGVDPETLKLLAQTSMKRRIQNYQRATEASNPTITDHTRKTTSSPRKGLTPASVIIAKLENRDDDENAASMLPPMVRPGTNLSESKSHTRPLLVCTVCRETIYPTESTVHSQGRLLHASCFSCQLCHAKLKHHPMELLLPMRDSYQGDEADKNGNENDDPQQRKQPQQPQPFLSTASYCICAKCRIDALYAHTTKIHATSAGQRKIISREEVGNVQGVKELIGEELEDILLLSILKQRDESHLPRCSPYRAAKYIPERWIVRLVWSSSSPSNATSGERVATSDAPPPQPPPAIMTLFFEWKTKQEDLGVWKKSALVTSSLPSPPVTISLVPYQGDNSSTTAQLSSSRNDQQGSQEHGTTTTRKSRRPTKSLPLSVWLKSVRCELVGDPLPIMTAVDPHPHIMRDDDSRGGASSSTATTTATCSVVGYGDKNSYPKLQFGMTEMVRFQVNHRIQLTIPILLPSPTTTTTTIPPTSSSSVVVHPTLSTNEAPSMDPTSTGLCDMDAVELDSSAAELSISLSSQP